MPFCSSGVTEPKPGVQRYIAYASGGAELIATFSELSWLQAVAVVLGLVAYDTTSLCGSDPPGFVSMDGTDIFNLISPVRLPGYNASLAKLQQNVDNLAWYQLCQCASVSTPAIPTRPTRPSDYPTITPTANQGVIRCQAANEGFFDLSSGATHSSVAIDLPANINYIDYTVENQSAFGTPHGTVTGTLRWQTNAGILVRNDSIGVDPTGADPSTLVATRMLPGLLAPAGAQQIILQLSAPAGVKDQGWNGYTAFCGGTTGGTQIGPCCGADPLVVQLLNEVLSQVTLVQRRMVPIAYIAGAVHSGVSGQGTFSVSGLLGVKVHLDTVPASYGSAVGQPTFRFVDTWLSLLTGDGLIDERRVTALDTVWTPRLASEATTWGYSFGPGITATITELEPEP